MKKVFFIIIAMIFMFPILSFATKVTLDIDKLAPDQAAMVLEAKKKIENPTVSLPQPDVVEKYAKMGAEIGAALKEVCKTIGIEVNEFVKTPVGKAVALLILYRYFGKDMIKLVLMFVFCSIVAICNTISLWWWVSKKKVVVKIDDKVKTFSYIERYEFNNNEARSFCVGCHVFIYVVLGIASISSICSL